MNDAISHSQMPMIRLQLIEPFVSILRVEESALAGVLGSFGLTNEMLSRTDVFVPARVMYALVEELSETSGDVYAGVHVGEQLDIFQWAPVTDALSTSTTLGDFLVSFTIAANKDATSVAFALEIRGDRATFSEKRVSDCGMSPRHNDGFGVGYMCKVLSLSQSGPLGESVLAHVCDPSVIPHAYRGTRVASTDTMGYSISFPATWLLRPLASEQPAFSDAAMNRAHPPRSAVNALDAALEPCLSDTDLTSSRVAAMVGTSERTLARQLSKHGTSISGELTRLRMERACTMLIEGQSTISSIAAKCGYANVGVFSRAFRRWTGQSPSQFRKLGVDASA